MTISVTATVFQRNFGFYKDEAIRSDIIEVTNHDRIIGGFLSATELAHYRLLKSRETQILKIGELDDETIELIENAEYGIGAK